MSDEPMGFLLAFTGREKTRNVERTFYVSNFAFTTTPDDDPASVPFVICVEHAFTADRTAFQPTATSRQSGVQFSTVSLNNIDRALSVLSRYTFGGRPATVWIGARSNTLLSQFARFTYTASQPVVNSDVVTLDLYDAKLPYDANIQPIKFAGTGGLEGGVDLAGKPKPILLGTQGDFAPVLLDPIKEIYQVTDGAFASVDRVENMGAELLFGGTYADGAALQNDALAPAFGYYKILPSLGYLRINTAATATDVLMTASEGATVADRTAAQLFRRASARVGVTDDALLLSDFAQLDIDQPAECGSWIGTDDVAAKDVCDRLATGAGCGWGARTLDGKVRLVRLEIPKGPVSRTLRETDSPRTHPIRQESAGDNDRGRPAKLVNVRWGFNPNVRSGTQLVDSVSAERRAYLLQPWRTASVANASVSAKYFDAIEITVDSCFTHEADALTEAARVLALRKEYRYQFVDTVFFTTENAFIDLFDVVGLRYAGLDSNVVGMNDGDPVYVLGVAPDADSSPPLIAVTVWGTTQSIRNLIAQSGALFRTQDGRYLVSHGV